MRQREFWFQMHWFIGITAGVVLAFVGLTGALLSYEHQIQDWLNRDGRTVEVLAQTTRLTPHEILARVTAQFPDRDVRSLVIDGHPANAVRVQFAAQSAAGETRGESRYFDPYSGDSLLATGNRGEHFFRTIRTLHRWLTAGEFGNQAIGRQIVGACTLLLVALSLSGLYLRWPRRVADLREWFAVRWKLTGRRFLWSLHAVWGSWVLIAYLVMALSGLYWSYEWYRDGLFAVTGAARPAARENNRGRDTMSSRAVAAERDVALAWAKFSMIVGSEGFRTATLSVEPRDGAIEIRYLPSAARHERATNMLTLDTASGALVKHERYVDKPFGARLMASIFAVHSGAYFGRAGALLFMLASLTMPLFAVTGWMLYLDRRRRKRHAATASSASAPVDAEWVR